MYLFPFRPPHKCTYPLFAPLWDAPGAQVGTDNGVTRTPGWTEIVFDTEFRTSVVEEGVRASDREFWRVQFHLILGADGKWSVVGGHTP